AEEFHRAIPVLAALQHPGAAEPRIGSADFRSGGRASGERDEHGPGAAEDAENGPQPFRAAHRRTSVAPSNFDRVRSTLTGRRRLRTGAVFIAHLELMGCPPRRP